MIQAAVHQNKTVIANPVAAVVVILKQVVNCQTCRLLLLDSTGVIIINRIDVLIVEGDMISFCQAETSFLLTS